MYNEKRPQSDTKCIRRKINNKVSTIARKSIELNTKHNCEILLIIYSSSNKHWIQYCSSDANSLFFGLQSSKENLSKIEEYDNSNYYKLLNSVGSVNNHESNKPMKYAKRDESCDESFQPIKVAGNFHNTLSVASTFSTEAVSSKIFNMDLVKKTQPPDQMRREIDLPNKSCNKHDDEEYSSDFDFEKYFASNNS